MLTVSFLICLSEYRALIMLQIDLLIRLRVLRVQNIPKADKIVSIETLQTKFSKMVE